MDVITSQDTCINNHKLPVLKSSRNNGVSLIEMMVSLAIISIVVIIGLPNLQNFFANNRLTTQTHEFIASMALARSEAVKRGQDVVICKSSDGEYCVTDNGWEQGWLVYTDNNQNHIREEHEDILHLVTELGGGTTARYSAFGSNHYIVYRSNGFTYTNGTLTFCSPGKPELARSLILYKTGRLRAARTKPDGSQLNCHI